MLIVVAGLAVYWNSFDGAFVLDDDQHIVGNQRLGEGRVWELLKTRRPLVELSLALNYAHGELDVWGYHLFNLVVHLLAGLTLYGVVRRTLLLPRLQQRYQSASSMIALATALLWVVHPLQTQSVTYVIQRGESMMGLCYLLAVYCLIRTATSPRRGLWPIGAAVAVGLGMGCKAIIITAPAVLLLYDRIFLARSFTEVVQRRWGLHAGVVGVILLVGVATSVVPTVAHEALQSQRTDGLSFSLGRAQTPVEYRATQPEVVLHYLRLACWPDTLCLDYKWAPVEHLRDALLPALCLVGLVGLTVWALIQIPPLGFLGAWFFIILAPTSMVWTLELAFEHRMYLPLAAVVLLGVVGVHSLLETTAWPGLMRLTVGALLALVAGSALGYRTVVRNRDYESRLTMNRAVVAARPSNDRAHYNIGNALRREGRVEEAIRAFEETIRVNPLHLNARINLAAALYDLGRRQEAIAHYREALKLNPRHEIGLYNLGHALLKQAGEHHQEGDTAGAVELFREVVLIYRRSLAERPRHFGSLSGLGYAHFRLGQLPEAEEALRRAVEVRATDAQVLRTLADVLYRQGRYDEAEAVVRQSLDNDPKNPWALRILSDAQAARER